MQALLIESISGFESMLSDNAYLFVVPLLLISAIAIVTIGFLWRKLMKNELLRYEFITIMAHKFRTPLTHIKWTSETLLSGETDPYKQENLKDMQTSNQKLIDLTGTLIELIDADSSKTLYSLEETDLCEFVRTVGNTVKGPFHRKNIFFSVHCDEKPVPVRIDHSRMEFVLQTLLENAYDYSQPGTNVDITVSTRKGKAVVSVVDHGIGIDPGDIGLIFTKFFRAKNAQAADTEGVGAGLFLSKSVVKRHGGKIEVYSEGLNRGTTFTIVLPIAG